MGLQSAFESALGTYREIEVLKRSQPRIVQQAEHQQTPFAQNVQAPIEPLKNPPSLVSVGGVGFNKNILLMTAAALGVVWFVSKDK